MNAALNGIFNIFQFREKMENWVFGYKCFQIFPSLQIVEKS